VENVSYVSKEAALEKWREKFRSNPSFSEIITPENNPLPRSLEILPTNPEDLDQIVEILDKNNYKEMITKISYVENKSIVKRLLSILQFIKNFGLILGLFFIAVSILVIFNTIRLAIFSRREEIEIMKLVGATSSFIRWPFILEANLYGLIAAGLSLLILYISFRFLSEPINRYLEFNIYAYFMNNLSLVIILYIALAFAVGFVCSNAAISKYLKIWSR